jgi:eukaryotic-like serine/threonine-protein kinase
MATVFLAVNRGESGFSKLVVVKVLKPHLAMESDVVTMFHDEARLSARLSHPNVVQTNEVGREDGHHMMVMEYLDGIALNQINERMRSRSQQLPLGMNLRMIHCALDGLHYAHELADYNGVPLGVVHRDVSPHNIFVTFDGQVKILDFGIAKLAHSNHETRAGTIKGKIRYMSPEQMRGDRVDRRADIFAVGAILWEAATGSRLWKTRTDVEIMHQVIHDEIPTPRSVKPDVPEALDRIIRKALSKNREDRYATCVDLQADLEKFLDSIGDKTSARDIARFVTGEFDDVRVERKRIIETQLKSATELGSGYFRAVTKGEVEVPTLPALPAYGSASHSILAHTASSPPKSTRRAIPILIALLTLAVTVAIFTIGARSPEPAAAAPSVFAPPASATPSPSPPVVEVVEAPVVQEAAVTPPTPSAEPKVAVKPVAIAKPVATVVVVPTAPEPKPSVSAVKKPARPIDSANPWSD